VAGGPHDPRSKGASAGGRGRGSGSVMKKKRNKNRKRGKRGQARRSTEESKTLLWIEGRG